MADNKSKLTIEDYKSDFTFKKKENGLNIQFNRVAFIFFVFFIIYLIYTIHLVHLGSRKSKLEKINNLPGSKNQLYRADIIDINGNYLAKTVKSIDIGLKTSDIINEKKLLLSLNIIFPDKNFDEIKKKIKTKKFFYLEKKISEENYEKIMKLGDKSLVPEERVLRMYPQKNLFSHVLGQIDDDNNGISGLEKTFDYELTTSKNPLTLTVDTEIQYLIREELMNSQNIFKNIGSAAILMDINTGDILSMVSLPDFDLNKRNKLSDLKFINRATKGVYEFGSVFKTFTIAAGINYDVIKPETEFNDLKKRIVCAGNTISEYDDKIPSDLTAEEILIRSGNIGSARIAEKIGIDKYNKFLQTIGILTNISFDIEEIGETQMGRWGKCKLLTVGFGHGIATTLLQLTKGYSIVSNGGFEVSPTLIKRSTYKKNQRILDKNVSKKLNPILRKIVSTEDGTAGFADVKGYEIAGKTGTADIASTGGYSKKKINTFASVFPASKPKFVLAVMLDEPKANKEFVYHYRDDRKPYKGNWRNTAGWTTVWVTGQIIEKIGPILATKY